MTSPAFTTSPYKDCVRIVCEHDQTALDMATHYCPEITVNIYLGVQAGTRLDGLLEIRN